jgi:hypothetical protein
MRNTWIGLGFAAVLATASLGCAKRLPLTPDELERIQTEAGISPLRVYTSKKVISYNEFDAKNQEYSVQKTIRESTTKRGYNGLITKNDSGLILAIGEQNGATALRVTFDARYPKPEDALVFVQTEDGKYRLHEVPQRAGYKPPVNYVGWKTKKSNKRRLKLGKMRSLAEANEVLLLKKRRGKLITIELQVKKITQEHDATPTRRAGGVD